MTQHTPTHSLIRKDEALANRALIIRAVNSHDALVKVSQKQAGGRNDDRSMAACHSWRLSRDRRPVCLGFLQRPDRPEVVGMARRRGGVADLVVEAVHVMRHSITTGKHNTEA